MSASGHLKAASGDYAGLQANRPRRSRFQPSLRFLAIGTKSGISRAAGKERRYVAGIILIIAIAAAGGTINPHSRSRRKKRVRRAARQSRGGA